MAALLTRPGVVADLISRNASCSRHCASHLEQIGGMVRIGGREFALAHQRVEPGARLNRELIEREMCRAKGQRVLQLRLPSCLALLRPGIDVSDERRVGKEWGS